MGSDTKVEHLISSAISGQQLDDFQNTLARHRFSLKSCAILSVETLHCEDTTFDSLKQGFPELGQKFVEIEINHPLGIPISLKFWKPRNTTIGLLLETEALRKGATVLQYSIPFGKLVDMAEQFRLEKLAQDLHCSLSCQKTVCYPCPLYGYYPDDENLEEKAVESVLKSNGDDPMFCPLILFGIVRLNDTSELEAFIEKLKRVRKDWPSTREKQLSEAEPFPLGWSQLSCEDYFIQYRSLTGL